MSVKKSDAQRIRKLLKGKKIKRVVVNEQSVSLRLDDGTKVTFSMKGGPGLDANWYDWFVVEQEGAVIYRG